MPVAVSSDVFARPSRRPADRDAVAVALTTIAAAVAARFHWRCPADRDDAVAEAVVHCLTNAEAWRNAPQPDAVGFFTTLAANRIRDHVRADARRRRRVGSLPPDFGGQF